MKTWYNDATTNFNTFRNLDEPTPELGSTSEKDVTTPEILESLGKLSVACGEATALMACGLKVPMSVWQEIVTANNAAHELMIKINRGAS